MSDILYSIGRASELSGVPIETVRIWERRYKVIEPQRTPGGHRKYSQEDIEVLTALKNLVEGGARVGSVARLPREEILAAGNPTYLAEDLEDEVEAVIAAAVRFDEGKLRELLRGPLATQHVLEVARRYYLPILHEIGDRWHRGEVSVAAEHLVEKEITGIIHKALQDLPADSNGPRVLAAGVEGDRHEVGLLVACLLMRSRKMAVTYLGGDLPVEDLVQVAERQRPDLVVLASLQAPTDRIVARLDAALGAGALKNADVWIGGLTAVNLCSRLSRGRAKPIENLGKFLVKLDKWGKEIRTSSSSLSMAN